MDNNSPQSSQVPSRSGTSTRSGSTKIAKLVPRDLSENLGKLPPQALDLEEAVLGASMLERHAVTQIIDVLHPEDFYTEQHAEIYRSICDLYNDSKPIDMRTIVAQLRHNGRLEIVGGAYYIAELTSRVSSAANIEYHARIIKEYSMRRQLITLSSQLQQDAYEDTIDVFDLLEAHDKAYSQTISPLLKKSILNTKQLLTRTFEFMSSRKDNNGITGVPSGFTALDRLTAGWQKGELIIIAARPGMGKTAFVISSLLKTTVDLEFKAAFFSLEMAHIAIGSRIIAVKSEVPLAHIIRNTVQGFEYTRMMNMTAKMAADNRLFVDDSAALSILELRARCRRLVMEEGVQLIVVDYLQLMKGDTSTRNREQEIASISRALKGIAKELEVPVIALSQLSRGVEQRGGDKRPMLADLRESGSIEQDADTVMFLYRPEYYGITQDEEGKPMKGVMEVIVAKHRQGALDNITLKFEGQYTAVSDWVDDMTTPGPNFTSMSKLPKMDTGRLPYTDDHQPPAPGSTDDMPF